MNQKLVAVQFVLTLACTTLSVGARAEDASDEATETASASDRASTVEVIGAPLHPHALPQDASVSGAVIRREQTEAPGLQTADVLRRVSGVEVAQYGGFGSIATASIRGATAEQTPVYLAGIRLNDEVAGVVDLSTVPLWLIDHIEIYRGNAPLFADELGIGGAIVFEPKRPEPGSAGAGLSAGSFGSTAGFAWAGAGTPKARTLVGLQVARAENDYPFTDDRGTRFFSGDDRVSTPTNADVSAFDGWFLERWDLGHDVEVNVVANATSREQGVPRLALLPSERARARSERVLAGVAARAPFGHQKAHVLRLSSSFISANSVYDDPEYELSLAAPRVEHLGQRAAQKVQAEFQLAQGLRSVSSLDGSVDRLERREGERDLESASAVTARAATGLDFEFAKAWFVSPLGALTCRHGAEKTSGCDQLEPVGRVAVSRRTPSFTSYASAGRYVRLPSLGEIHGSGILVRGNSHLLPERGATAEVGARVQHVMPEYRLWADAAVYARRADRMVSFVRNSQGHLVPVNVRAAEVRGVEAGVGADLGRHFASDLSLTFLDPRDTTPDRRIVNDFLPFHSRFVGALGLEGRTAPHLPGRIECTQLRVAFLHQSSRYADPAGLVVIPEQSTVDLELEQAFVREVLHARARWANVFNTDRFDSVGYPLPGRSLHFSIEVRFE